MPNIRVFVAAIVLSLCSARSGMAAIQLGPPFGEHMVLQQGVPVPIWGSGCPGGDTVRVSIAGQSVTARSDWAGRWLVILAPMKAGGPYQMLVQIGGVGRLVNSSAATAQGFVELNDIVVGEVRVMTSLTGGNAAGIAGPENTETPSAWIRVYKVSASASGEAQGAQVGRWTVALADTASGASYAFARKLYDQVGVPIGVIERPAGP